MVGGWPYGFLHDHRVASVEAAGDIGMVYQTSCQHGHGYMY